MRFPPAAALGVGLAAGLGLLLAVASRRRDDEPDEEESDAPPAERPEPAPARARPAALVWFGPASRAQVGGATLGAEIPTFFFTCTGDGTPTCGQLADRWKDASGRRLPNMRAALRIPPGPLAVAAYSAGGHIVRRLLEHPADRDEIALAALSDATYTTEWDDQKAGRAKPIPSFVEYAKDVSGDEDRLFLATASSSPNKEHPTGAQTLAAIATAAGLTPIPPEPLAGERAPARIWVDRRERPSVILLDYAAAYSHEGQVRRPKPSDPESSLAEHLWTAIVRPTFGGSAA